MDEYANEFDRLHCLCKPESETHDCERFLQGLQPSILKNKKDRKDMHEAYEEAIRVEQLIKLYCIQKVKVARGKFNTNNKSQCCGAQCRACQGRY